MEGLLAHVGWILQPGGLQKRPTVSYQFIIVTTPWDHLNDMLVYMKKKTTSTLPSTIAEDEHSNQKHYYDDSKTYKPKMNNIWK